MFNMINEVKVSYSSGNMLKNEKFKCLANVACRQIYEKRIGGVTSGIRADYRDHECMQSKIMEK